MARLEEEGPEVVQEAVEAHQLLLNQIFLKKIPKNLKRVLEVKVGRLKVGKEGPVKIQEHIMEGKTAKIKTQAKIKIPLHQKLPQRNRQPQKQKLALLFRLVQV